MDYMHIVLNLLLIYEHDDLSMLNFRLDLSIRQHTRSTKITYI